MKLKALFWIVLAFLPVVNAGWVTYFSCSFDVDNCGASGAAAAGGILNLSSTTTWTWNATLFNASNISMDRICPTGGNGHKMHVANSASDWLLDSTTWKNEPAYSINYNTGVLLDTWQTDSFVTNHTANTSQVCVGTGCSTSGAFGINSATTSMQIETTYAGGDCSIDNLTIRVLDTEYTPPTPPTNWSLKDNSNHGLNYTLYNGAKWEAPNTLNLSATNMNGWAATDLGFNHSGTLNLSTGYAISTWARWNPETQITTNGRTALNVNNLTGSFPYTQIVFRNNTGTTRVYFRLQTNTSNCDQTAAYTSDTAQTDGLWHHYMGVMNGTHVILYRDGSLVTSTAFSAGCLNLDFPNKNFGNFRVTAGGTGVENFSGLVREQRIYSYPLNPSEVYSVYLNQSISCNNLAFNMPFNESQQTCTDYRFLDKSPLRRNNISSIVNVTWQLENGVPAFNFSGGGSAAGSYLRVTFSQSLNTTAGTTLFGKVKYIDNDSSDSTGVLWRTNAYGLRVERTSKVVTGYIYNNTYVATSSTSTVSNTGQIHTLGFSHDGYNTTLYQNGTLNRTGIVSFQNQSSSSSLDIGAQDLSRNWVGLIYDVKVFNRSLTALEHAKLSAGQDTACDALVMWIDGSTQMQDCVETFDTCSYTGVGNWNINAADNCIITGVTDLLSNNITISGTGNVSVALKNLTNWKKLEMRNGARVEFIGGIN